MPTLTVKACPLLATAGKLVLREGLTNTIDAVIWGTTIVDRHAMDQPQRTALQQHQHCLPAGRFIYRKLDEATGKIISDTNTALDWANDRTDPVSGRKTQYPGWDLEKFWQTAKVTQTATLTVAIAPDNAYRVISDVLGSAQSSIKMELHTFDNLGLLEVVTTHDRTRRQRDDLVRRRPGGRHRRSGIVGVPADRKRGRTMLVHDQQYVERQHHPCPL